MKTVKTGKSGDGADAEELRLLRRTADNDRVAFEALFESYRPRLFMFLFRLTRSHGAAEELTNDVLLTVWNDADRFRGDSKPSTWIFGIAYRQALAHIRKNKTKRVRIVDQDAAVDESVGHFEREDWVRRGIDELPPKQKLTVMLVYYLGLSCAETAKVSAVPVSTVKTRMFNARKNMKRHLVESQVPRKWRKDFDDD